MKRGDAVRLANNCWFCREPGVLGSENARLVMGYEVAGVPGLVVDTRELPSEDQVISPQMWYRVFIPTLGTGWVNHTVLEILYETG